MARLSYQICLNNEAKQGIQWWAYFIIPKQIGRYKTQNVHRIMSGSLKFCHACKEPLDDNGPLTASITKASGVDIINLDSETIFLHRSPNTNMIDNRMIIEATIAV